MIRLKKIFRDYNLYFKDCYFVLSQVSSKGKDSFENAKNELGKIPAANGYRDFLSVIREETSFLIPQTFLVIIDREEKSFTILVNPFLNSRNWCDMTMIRPLIKYVPETEGLYDFCYKLFRFDDKSDIIFINSLPSNNFSFVCNLEVLETLFSRNKILTDGEKLYHTFKIESKNGKVRDITAPHPELKESLRSLNILLQKIYDRRNADFQVAYKKGKSVIDGAKLHKDHKYIFNMDLKDFYPSCHRDLVKKYTDILFSNSYNREFIEEEFLDSILRDDALFIGSPISGCLANVIISYVVEHMRALAAKKGMTLSVYADDITFSSDSPIKKRDAIGIFEYAFTKAGLESYFKLNKKKLSSQSGCHRKVTGVSINDSNNLTVKRQFYRFIRTQIDHLQKGNNVDIGVLRGRLAYATFIDESGKVARYLHKYEDTVKKFNLCSDEKLSELFTKFKIGEENN